MSITTNESQTRKYCPFCHVTFTDPVTTHRCRNQYKKQFDVPWRRYSETQVEKQIGTDMPFYLWYPTTEDIL